MNRKWRVKTDGGKVATIEEQVADMRNGGVLIPHSWFHIVADGQYRVCIGSARSLRGAMMKARNLMATTHCDGDYLTGKWEQL